MPMLTNHQSTYPTATHECERSPGFWRAATLIIERKCKTSTRLATRAMAMAIHEAGSVDAFLRQPVDEAVALAQRCLDAIHEEAA